MLLMYFYIGDKFCLNQNSVSNIVWESPLLKSL